MINSRTIARQSLLNFVGLTLPILLALVSIPYTIRGLGTERFGILTVAWTTVGYFSLFDLGLAAALTKIVAEKLAATEAEEIPSIAWTGEILMMLLGVFGAVILALLTPLLTYRVLKIPPAFEREGLISLYLIAFSIPWVIGAAGLRGLLEAHQRFGAVNALRVPMGAFTYLAPLAVLPFSNSLVPVVGALVLGRIAAWVGHLLVCFREIPSLARPPVLRRDLFGMLARYGGWVTASNISSTLMTYLDRFLIGAVISMAAVTYYTTPYDTVTRVWLLPTAILGALFPALSATFVRDRERTSRLFDQGIRVLFLAIFPITLVVVTLAREGLGLWLGADFSVHSARVLQWLAVGVLINSIGMVPGAGLQGIGRPELTGKLNMVELPFYVVVLWVMLRTWGIEGAAVAWVLRVAVDTAILCMMADRVLPAGSGIVRRTAALLVPAIVLLAGAAFLPTLGTRLAFLVAVALPFLVIAWHWVLTPNERRLVGRRVHPERDVTAAALHPPL